jgi:3-deoxy-D-manno-octulosonate 8-phosphate phosphatase (KDO 8-P phosphatase)
MPERIDPALARRVRVVVLDVDGVLTDNGVYIGQTGEGERVELKRFHILDGLGLKMLQWAGLRVVLVSGRQSPATTLRAAELGLECRQVDAGYKLPLVRTILDEAGADWAELAALGDDLPDLAVLERAGFPAAVANATPEILARASWVSSRPGGAGAAREFAEALLRARGQWSALVDAYHRSREAGADVKEFVPWA